MPNQEGFPLVSGHLSLDLVNTEVVRRGVRHDLLVSEEDLVDWIETMKESGSLMAEQECQVGVRSERLHSLRGVRAFLRNGFEEIANEGHLPDDWQSHLEELIDNAPLSYRILAGNLVPIPVGNSVHTLASLVALDALRLLASGDLYTLRRCTNPDCVLLFMDASGRRKWCSMKICGNREKVARHQSRHKS